MKSRVMVLAAWAAFLVLAGTASAALTNYTWNGSTDSDWMNAANWSAGNPGGLIAPTGVVSETRVNVSNPSSANELQYTSSMGTTVFAGTSGTPRSLVIGLNGNGQLRVTGGVLEGRGNNGTQGAADLIGGSNSGTPGTGRLIIDGGTTVSGFEVGIGRVGRQLSAWQRV